MRCNKILKKIFKDKLVILYFGGAGGGARRYSTLWKKDPERPV